MIEGGSPASLVNLPGAVIVFGGTFGVAFVAFSPKITLNLPKIILQIFKQKLANPVKIIDLLIELADKARRQGLLSLEEDEEKLVDPFLKRAIQLVVDGTDPETVRQLLEIDTRRMTQRHLESSAILDAMGGYAPTMGIIGTVMGLVNVLGKLGEDPAGLGESIATAFLATLYGVGSANLLWLPLGSKLKQGNSEELLLRQLMTEGVLSIQAGDNPRVVRSKLEAYLPPRVRGAVGQGTGEAAHD